MNRNFKITFLFLAVAAFVELAFAAHSFAASCPTSLETVSYSANFSFPKSDRKLSIRVGTTKSWDSQEYFIAQIASGNDCQAVCRVKNIARDELTQSPIAMDLDCQGVGFRELTTPATLLWKSTLASDSTIRFGTWLGGYEQAALDVKFDKYSATRNLAQIPSYYAQ